MHGTHCSRVTSPKVDSVGLTAEQLGTKLFDRLVEILAKNLYEFLPKTIVLMLEIVNLVIIGRRVAIAHLGLMISKLVQKVCECDARLMRLDEAGRRVVDTTRRNRIRGRVGSFGRVARRRGHAIAMARRSQIRAYFEVSSLLMQVGNVPMFEGRPIAKGALNNARLALRDVIAIKRGQILRHFDPGDG